MGCARMMTEEEIQRRARHKAGEIIGFLSHLIGYIGVNVMLFLIDYLTSERISGHIGWR